MAELNSLTGDDDDPDMLEIEIPNIDPPGAQDCQCITLLYAETQIFVREMDEATVPDVKTLFGLQVRLLSGLITRLRERRTFVSDATALKL